MEGFLGTNYQLHLQFISSSLVSFSLKSLQNFCKLFWLCVLKIYLDCVYFYVYLSAYLHFVLLFIRTGSLTSTELLHSLSLHHSFASGVPKVPLQNPGARGQAYTRYVPGFEICLTSKTTNIPRNYVDIKYVIDF